MQAIQHVVTFASAGEIRKADVFFDREHNLFRVVYSNDCQPDVFTSQTAAEKAASDFVH